MLLVIDVRCRRLHQSDADRTGQQRQHQRSLHVRTHYTTARRHDSEILQQMFI